MTFSCKRCAYQWDAQKKDAPKDFVPKQCPHCKSTLWNKDYIRGPKKKLKVLIIDDAVEFRMPPSGVGPPIRLVNISANNGECPNDLSYAEQVRLAMEKLK